MDSRNMAFTETVSPTASKESVYCVCVFGSDGVMSQKRSANFAGSRRSGIKPSFAFYLTQYLPLPLFNSAAPQRVKPLSWSSTLTFVTNVAPITTIVYRSLSRCHIRLGWNVPCMMSQVVQIKIRVLSRGGGAGLTTSTLLCLFSIILWTESPLSIHPWREEILSISSLQQSFRY